MIARKIVRYVILLIATGYGIHRAKPLFEDAVESPLAFVGISLIFLVMLYAVIRILRN